MRLFTREGQKGMMILAYHSVSSKFLFLKVVVHYMYSLCCNFFEGRLSNSIAPSFLPFIASIRMEGNDMFPLW
jgi:hypothetical protein